MADRSIFWPIRESETLRNKMLKSVKVLGYWSGQPHVGDSRRQSFQESWTGPQKALNPSDVKGSGEGVENAMLHVTSFSMNSLVLWSMMVWEGISIGNITLTARRCEDESLGPTVKPYTGAVGPGFLLVHDNAWRIQELITLTVP